MDDLPSSQTLAAESSPPEPKPTVSGLDLSSIPPIAVLGAHFKGDEETNVKATLRLQGAPLTTDVSIAKVFIGKVGTKRRAEFELRSRKFKVEEVLEAKRPASPVAKDGPTVKRRKGSVSSNQPIIIHDDGSTTEDEPASASELEDALPARHADTPITSPPTLATAATEVELNQENQQDDFVWVIKVDWLDACMAARRMEPLGEYVVYKGRVLERPKPLAQGHKSIKDVFAPKVRPTSQAAVVIHPRTSQSILDRAKSDVSTTAPKTPYHSRRIGSRGSRRFDGKTFGSGSRGPSGFASQTARLLQGSTGDDDSEDADTPPPPDWVKKGIKYACQRRTPAEGPNEDFLSQLRKIRTARTLIEDEIGVRAYSTIIASIAAYPYKLTHPRQIAQLPGCDEKTAVLFVEWKNTGKIQAVEEFENDKTMQILNEFYNIWGVGAKTARNFYYNNHWTELDDIIEFGWNDLDRVQQIGVKYYDQFLEGIPRAEVERIADVVREHAVRLRDDRITVTLVGGYRRGKAASGDVDLIVSHPDLDATAGLVEEIVRSLEDAEWITHTLTMSLHNTHRGQSTLPFRTTKASGGGHDTLDKALVVWQDPHWPSREADLAANPRVKNPNIHRRVDIIISPWRTVGCAVMGWSGGTTFQRDLRRYAKYVKGWKFDSSGIRSRSTGEVVQLEGPEGVDGTPEDAEKRVFEGLGLEYVAPEFRCTY